MSDEQLEIGHQLRRIADMMEHLNKPIIHYKTHDPCSGRTWVEDEVLADLRFQAQRAHCQDHNVVKLKARVHEVIAECWQHANNVKELEQANADLRKKLGEAHKVEYKGRVQDLQDLCRKREREVVRLRLERKGLDSSIEMYKGQHETDKRIHTTQAKIIRTLRRDLTTAQHCQPCGLHRVACPKCGGCGC